MLPPEATQADIDKLTKAYGFDKPLIHQYWIFNTKLLRGDLGDALAWDKRPTLDVVWERIPATFQLARAVVGVFSGRVAYADRALDHVGSAGVGLYQDGPSQGLAHPSGDLEACL